MAAEQFTISLFTTIGDTRPLVKSCTWEGFCKGLSTPKVRADKDGQLFSPARYAGNRRLQTNVIDLSMLVLEIDGAWRCLCCGHAGPHVMFVSNRIKDDAGRVDRSPRCPACLKAKCAECYRPKPKPHTETTIERIEFTFASVIEGMQRTFPGNAFAIYSTHSHQRVTAVVCGRDGLCGAAKCTPPAPCGAVFGHEVAEPCYRLIIPLASPVPAAEYATLWHRAVMSLRESEVIIDGQAKDPNRIFYTPVKASNGAVYEFHIEPGAFFDWKQSLESPCSPKSGRDAARGVTGRAGEDGLLAMNAGATPRSDSGTPDFVSHEDRNDELGRRIAARGKQNTRGHFDAKCLAHNGRGSTSLVYVPDSGAVFCNAGCDYFEILKAEGLPDNELPSRDRLAIQAARSSISNLKSQISNLDRSRPLTTLDLDVVYSMFLAHFCELSSDHESLIRKHWDLDPFGEEWEWYGAEARPARPRKMASMPNSVQKAAACRQLSEWFDLRGVPGFYLDVTAGEPHAPSRAADMARWHSENFGEWRINLPYRKGLLVPYYDEERGYVIGIQIYQSVRDRSPMLLTSKGLPGGGKAIMPRERRVA
jgi:hypothetical protein